MTKSVIDKKTADVPHIFHVIPSFAHGGVPIRISYLMNHFGPLARHSLLSTDGIYSCESRLNQNVIYEIPEIGTAAEGNMLKRLWHYRKILREMKPDLLLTYNWGSTEWAMANSIRPVCRHFHLESGFGPEEANGTIGRRNLFRRLALRNIEGIVVPSNTLVKICAADWKIPTRKILYTPNGVDCDLYASPPQEGIIPHFTKQAGEITIGTMTPLRPEKNLPRLITAFNKLVQSRPAIKTSLIIMGEGSERPKLESMIADYGLQDRIYLAGHIDNPAMALGHLDIYALSSDTEQMPNSVNQAMAAGLPVAGLDVGDVKFIVSTSNKPFITAAGDDQAFASALTELTANKLLRQEIGGDNKRHVKKTYDQSRMFAAYAKIWGVTAS